MSFKSYLVLYTLQPVGTNTIPGKVKYIRDTLTV